MHHPCTFRRPDAAAAVAVSSGKLPPGEWFLCRNAGFARNKTFVSPTSRNPQRLCDPSCPGYVANTSAEPDKPGVKALPLVTSKRECVHFGDPTGEEVLCQTCAGSVRLKTFACAVHGTCTVAKKADGHACCATCRDRTTILPEAGQPVAEYDPGTRRKHLAFHVYPSARNSVWRRAVEQLRMRWELFDGQKVIGVVRGEGLDDPADVADCFAGLGAEVFAVDNDHGLREVATWQPIWDRILPRAGDRDVVFYGHAKGVTRPVNPGNMTHRWASLLYSLNLDYWPLMERILDEFPIAGAFKKVGVGFGKRHGGWHFTGSFYWLRIDELRKRMNRVPMPAVWFGVECWPGMAYRVREAGCLFGEGSQKSLDLYRPSYWQSVVLPELQKWLAKSANARWSMEPSRSDGGRSAA